MRRRDFLKNVSTLPLGGALYGQDAGRQMQESSLKLSLNAYSFNKLLNDASTGRGAGVTLLDVLDFAAKDKFEGLDATGYYFPGYPATPSDAYVDSFKRRASDLGIGISGTGVRNNFTPADAAVREAGVAHVMQWIPVAARLGAPVLRVFADTQNGQTWETVAKGHTREQVEEWIAADVRKCADYGEKHGVKIGVQNHGDFLRTGEQVLSLIKAVDSKWCGPILDIGSFKTADPYVDIALVAPHAINWQIKQSLFGESETPPDLIKLIRIVRRAGYRGYLPIETLPPRGKEYVPYTAIPAFHKQVLAAIAETAKS